MNITIINAFNIIKVFTIIFISVIPVTTITLITLPLYLPGALADPAVAVGSESHSSNTHLQWILYTASY